jgi:hypothetical protein
MGGFYTHCIVLFFGSLLWFSSLVLFMYKPQAARRRKGLP